jgi:hypothetical protein
MLEHHHNFYVFILEINIIEIIPPEPRLSPNRGGYLFQSANRFKSSKKMPTKFYHVLLNGLQNAGVDSRLGKMASSRVALLEAKMDTLEQVSIEPIIINFNQ